MRNDETGLCSLQEYNQFKTRIFDAIDEWRDHYGCEPIYGLLVYPATLQVSVGERHDNGIEWYPIDALLEGGEASANAVLDFADQFCFVR